MGWIRTGTIAGAAQQGAGVVYAPAPYAPAPYPPPAFPPPPFITTAAQPAFMYESAFPPSSPRIRPAGLLFLGAFALIALAVASSREPVYC